MTQPIEKLRVLCVDDEPHVVEGLTLHLRRRYDVVPATSGAAGLAALETDPSIAVVMSDLRMPLMDGAAFLAQARQVAPDAVRVLLTGHADVGSAIAAVNDGQIFRFLTKPCPPSALVSAVDGAAEQHRLVTAERVLLERTLHGSIKALTDVLALTSPASFGRATRVKQKVTALAVALGMRERWQVEVAAMLSQLGAITLPAETVEKVHYGRPLTDAERSMVERVPTITHQLLESIPRLEVVRGILSASAKPLRRLELARDDADRLVLLGAHVLRTAIELDALEAQGMSASLAADTLRGRAGIIDPQIVEALSRVHASSAPRDEVRELPISAIAVGMVFAADVKTRSGTLLVTHGYEVTQGFVERARNFAPGTVQEPVRVIVRSVRRAA